MKDSNVFHRKMKLPYRLVIICRYAKAEQVFSTSLSIRLEQTIIKLRNISAKQKVADCLFNKSACFNKY